MLPRQLPSATTDIAHLPYDAQRVLYFPNQRTKNHPLRPDRMLQYLEGSESFFRALAGADGEGPTDAPTHRRTNLDVWTFRDPSFLIDLILN